MARPVITGTHVIPQEVAALKPKRISCDIKVIITNSKTTGPHKHYYVYEKARIGSGKTIGKIENGKFCPNARGVQLLEKTHKDKQDSASTVVTGNAQKSNTETGTLSDQALNAVREAANNLKVDIDEVVPQMKAYGEYAVVLACTEEVLRKLEQQFSDHDARWIYILSIICFVQEYTSACGVEEVFDNSILSMKWPGLSIRDDKVGSFLKLLGQHPGICDAYSQDRIDESSGLTAIDGQVNLTCSKQNDLADYENAYQRLTNSRIIVLQAYDAINRVPLTSTTFDGDVVDSTFVHVLLDLFHFPGNTLFLIDKGFYAEEDMELYREEGRHFVIPVPDHAVISKAMKTSIAFTDSFKYKMTDENGIESEDIILYRESTVEDLENIYQTILNERTQKKDPKVSKNGQKGELAEEAPEAKVNRSAYGKDRVIMFRDERMNDKIASAYRDELGTDAHHTVENLDKLSPQFGLIILRTNLPKETTTAPVLYANYKTRWSIQKHYNFVENAIQFYDLQVSDYCTMQGLSFLMLPVGQIRSAFEKRMAESSQLVSHLSVRKCLAKAGCFKLVQCPDKKWRITMASQEKIEVLREMGVNVSEDLKKLNKSPL